MRIAVHSRADVRVPRDGLQRLHVQVCRCHRDVRMPEHMRRCPVHVDRPADALPASLVGHLRDGQRPVAEDVLPAVRHGVENILQLRAERNQANACGTLRRADVAPVPGETDGPVDADQLAVEVDVLPLQAQGFATPDAGEDQQRHQHAVLGFQPGQIVDDVLFLVDGQGIAHRFLLRHRQTLAARWLDGAQAVLDGGFEDAMQQNPHRPHSGTRLVSMLVVEPLHVRRGDGIQPHRAEERDQVVADDQTVVQGRARGNLGFL